MKTTRRSHTTNAVNSLRGYTTNEPHAHKLKQWLPYHHCFAWGCAVCVCLFSVCACGSAHMRGLCLCSCLCWPCLCCCLCWLCICFSLGGRYLCSWLCSSVYSGVEVDSAFVFVCVACVHVFVYVGSTSAPVSACSLRAYICVDPVCCLV